MKGLEIARAYYEQYGEPMLREKFPGLMPFVAAGLAGSGSECWGFDDEISRDHDFEPGFSLFLPGEEIFRNMLSNEKHRAKIEQALKDCGGLNPKFEAASNLPPPDPDAGKRREENMNSLIDMFGRDKVQIDE